VSSGTCCSISLGVRGKLGAAGLGPMSVDPWVQREGVGSSPVSTGLAMTREGGVPAAFGLVTTPTIERSAPPSPETEKFQTPLKGPHFFAVRLRFVRTARCRVS